MNNDIKNIIKNFEKDNDYDLDLERYILDLEEKKFIKSLNEEQKKQYLIVKEHYLKVEEELKSAVAITAVIYYRNKKK